MYMGYDTFARATASFQQTVAQGSMQSYQMGYGYDLSGAMTSETYPSGKVVNMAYDTAGRVTTVSKQGGGNYASSIAYAPQGAIASMTLGNMLLEQTTFNSRLQPTLIQLGVSTSNAQSVLGLAYRYSTTGHTDNNGNVLSQAINAGTTLIGSQSYTYDGVDRLQTAMEGSAWNQTYDYDQFGNRAVRVTSQYIPNPQLTPTSTATGDLSASISVANNRIIMQGFGYDLAGNLTGDPTTGLNNIAYDAENRQTSYTKSATTVYGYDGDGHRVTRTTGGATTVFVYNVGGQLIAEYGGQATNGGTSYLTTDNLGSTRVVTDKNKGVIARHDYLPFGEEIPANVGSNRTAGLGYVTTDDTSQRFTSKERDAESGLDYFGARYCSSAQGRFTGPDPLIASAKAMEPQTWNRYVYVTDNPLRYIDTDGKIRRDKHGNPKFGKEGGERTVQHPSGPTAKVQPGNLYADSGDKIEAQKLAEGDKSFKTDCHGLTFADGKYWINNDQVDKLLKGDNYGKTDAPQVGDVAVYRDANGNVVHSTTVSGVDEKGTVTEVSGLGGLEPAAHSDKPQPGPEGAWKDPNAKVEYYHKGDDKRTPDEKTQHVKDLKEYKKED